jgi:polyhydroxyalkanoate synthesis regulator protein
MNPNMNRWLVSATWLAAVVAVISASTKGAMGVGAMWAIPAAIAVTMGAMGWPDKPASRVLAALGVVWQLALIGAYWPFAAADDLTNATGPMKWHLHSIVILVVLVLLAMSFVALYVLPALGLSKMMKRAAFIVQQRPADFVDQVSRVFEKDAGLMGLWREYLGQVRQGVAQRAEGSEDGEAEGLTSSASARDVFDAGTVAHSRLRLEFFRNLPGVFTGIGIIGTFSGLISGLRAFQISQDPSVVQRSLELLLSGVWGAFLISAVAIAMAIVVTFVEKVLSSSMARHIDLFAGGLDGLFPPRPQDEAQSWMPRLVEALGQLARAAPMAAQAAQVASPAAAAPAAAAAEPAAAADDAATRPAGTVMSPMVPMPLEETTAETAAAASGYEAPGMPAAMGGAGMSSHLLEVAQATRAATLALGETAQRLPEMLSQSMQGFAQHQTQSTQTMKGLASRLESVASGIEFSARKTLETVAARLMQSEMNMVSRHHAVADHLGELVQRIEALCGLLQQDRADVMRGGGMGDGYDNGLLPFGQQASQPPQQFAQGYVARAYPGGQDHMPPPEPGFANNGYGQMAEDEGWQDPMPDNGGFGR